GFVLNSITQIVPPMKLKYTLTLLSSVLFMLNSFAQVEIRSRKLSYGIFASPDISFRYIEENTLGGNTSRSFSGRAMLAFTAGGELIYQANPHVSITSGIQYSVKRSRTPNTFYFNNNPTVSFDPEPISGYQIFNSRYIDIPIRLDLYLTRTKLAPFLTAGLSTNILIHERRVTRQLYSDGKTRSSSRLTDNGYYRINPQVQLGAGLDLEMWNVRMRILTLLRMSLMPVNTGSQKVFLNSVGFGGSFYFGK
ncbi:MAG: outer membrane beta-barrel protein, partial [Bacteroidia bacterium]